MQRRRVFTFAEENLINTLRDIWNKRRVQSQDQPQRFAHGTTRGNARMFRIFSLRPEAVFDHLQVIITEDAPEELLRRLTRFMIRVVIKRCGNYWNDLVQLHQHPAIFRRPLSKRHGVSLGVKAAELQRTEARSVPELHHQLAAILDIALVKTQIMAQRAARSPEAHRISAELPDHRVWVVTVVAGRVSK